MVASAPATHAYVVNVIPRSEDAEVTPLLQW